MTHVFKRIKQLTNHFISWNWVGWDLEGRLKRGYSEFFEHHRWIGLKGWIIAQILIHAYLLADSFYARNDADFSAVTVIILVPIGAFFLSMIVLTPYQIGWSKGFHEGFYSTKKKNES